MLKIVPALRSGCSTAGNDRGGAVLGVAVMVQRQAVVGDDDSLPAVEDAPHDRPLARHGLVRAVQVRIAEVRGVRMRREHGLFGADDAVALLVDRGIVDERAVLGDRHRQSGRLVQPARSSTRGTRARRRPTRTDRSDPPSPPRPCAAVRTSRRRRPTSCRPARRETTASSYGSAWMCTRSARRLRSLVRAAVQDRDVVPVLDEPLHDRDAARARAADHQDAHAVAQPITRA